MELLGIHKVVKDGANTRDIMEALRAAAPLAAQQLKPYVRSIIKVTGDPVKDAEALARFVNTNFHYKKDGLTEQQIKLPSALWNLKEGDCKSFSLFVLGGLLALGYQAGFTFAAYSGKQFTHVYNFVVGSNKKIYSFDSCLKHLKESPNFTNRERMFVSYVAEPEEISGRRRERRRERREQRREERKERREEGGRGANRRRVTAAPMRNAFLLLLKLNFRGFASKLAKGREKNPQGVRKFWLKLGGDPNKLNTAIDQGKNKRPLLGQKGVTGYLGEVATASGAVAAIAAATPILIALPKLLEALGVGKDKEAQETANEVIAEGGQALGDFEAVDPETPEAKAETEKTTPGASSGGSNNMLLLAGAALAAFLIFKK